MGLRREGRRRGGAPATKVRTNPSAASRAASERAMKATTLGTAPPARFSWSTSARLLSRCCLAARARWALPVRAVVCGRGGVGAGAAV